MAVNKWSEYLVAAQRKVSVAEFHLSRLRDVLTTQTSPEVPIEVQAHFEGAVVSVVAAVDQVAQAANAAFSLSAGSGDLFDKAFGVLRERLADVDAWCQEPIGRDLRSIRVRIIHYSYSKAAHEMGWVVEPGRSEYRGARDLVAYATSAVDYGKRLVGLLPSIESQLRDGGSSE